MCVCVHACVCVHVCVVWCSLLSLFEFIVFVVEIIQPHYNGHSAASGVGGHTEAQSYGFQGLLSRKWGVDVVNPALLWSEQPWNYCGSHIYMKPLLLWCWETEKPGYAPYMYIAGLKLVSLVKVSDTCILITIEALYYLQTCIHIYNNVKYQYNNCAPGNQQPLHVVLQTVI